MAFLGIDIGCISLKAALVGDADELDLLARGAAQAPDLFHLLPSGLALAGTHPVLATRYRRIKGSPSEATAALLDELFAVVPADAVRGVRVTGSGGRLISQALEATYENEFKAIARGLSGLHPDVVTVFEMGGETSKFLRLDTDGTTGRTGIADYQTNGDCAAGTGSFMDQQASRLLYEIEDVGGIVIAAGRAANIAGRCSVFAKSDMIHAQQKGYQPPEVLQGPLRRRHPQLQGHDHQGQDHRVACGLHRRRGRQRGRGAGRARRLRPLRRAALRARSLRLDGRRRSRSDRGRPRRRRPGRREPRAALCSTPPACRHRCSPRPSRCRPSASCCCATSRGPTSSRADGAVIDTFLGIDVGSVSTNLVVLDQAGEVVKAIYTKTQARPVEVVDAGLAEIRDEIGDRIRVLGLGTTGSGRELVGELCGADLITDEITAHKTGADFISRSIARQVDTIFEIGGQDSKFISMQDGIVVDFAMNEACAAGTGSFLEEQAEKLGIDIVGEFADLALQSTAPIRLGERCTVFMERDVMSYQSRGASRKDLVAGLAYSIAYNYLNRLVRERKIGDCIFFQGGTAYNDAVAAAFAQILGKEIIVPPHNGVMGAIGMALLARERMGRTGEVTTFRGWDLSAVDYTVKDFVCKHCSNECDIRQFTIEGEKTYWGDKCSDRYRKRAKVDKKPVSPISWRCASACCWRPSRRRPSGARRPASDGRHPARHVHLRSPAVLGDPLRPPRRAAHALARHRQGHPRERRRHDRRRALFPDQGGPRPRRGAIRAGRRSRLPAQRAKRGDRVPRRQLARLPLGTDAAVRDPHRAPRLEHYPDRLLSPRVRFRLGIDQLERDLQPLAASLGAGKARPHDTVTAADAAMQAFRAELAAAGRAALADLETSGELGIVVIGRPYNMYDKGVNMDIPRKLRTFYGVNVIPMDFLPLKGIDVRDVVPNMYWNYGRKILQAATFVGGHERLHIIYLTNFKCGPDSYIKHYIRAASAKPFLTLQFDEHQNDAGAMTRCEAYLDSKGFLRWWSRDGDEDFAGVPLAESGERSGAPVQA